MQVPRRGAGVGAAVILGILLHTAADSCPAGSGVTGSRCQPVQEGEDDSGLVQLATNRARPSQQPAIAREAGVGPPQPLPADRLKDLMHKSAGILDKVGGPEGVMNLLGSVLDDVGEKAGPGLSQQPSDTLKDLMHKSAGILDKAGGPEGVMSLLGSVLDDVGEKAGQGLSKPLSDTLKDLVHESAGISDTAGVDGGMGLLSSALEVVGKKAGSGLSKPLSDTIKDLVHESKGALDNAAAQGVISLLNSTLENVGKKVDEFLANCTAYKDGIIKNASAGADTEIDRGIQSLQSNVKEHMGSIEEGWSAITNLLSKWKGPTVSGLKTLGLPKEADAVDQAYDAVGAGAANVLEILRNTTGTIATLGNGTKEEKGRVLESVDALFSKGLAATTAFNEHFLASAQRLVKSLKGKLDITKTEVKEALRLFETKIDDLAGKVRTALKSVFTGTHEATKLVIKASNTSKPIKSEAIGIRAPIGLAIMVASLVVGQL